MRNLTIILPGLLVAATGVGAGDLITGALAGNNLGPLIILPLIGAFLKYILTEGIARYQFATGKPLIHGWMKELGAPFKYVFYFYLFIWAYTVGGALLNATSSAAMLFVPLSKTALSFFFSGLAFCLVWSARFEIFEKLMAVLIGVMFIAVIGTSFFLIESPAALMNFSRFQFSSPWFLGLIGGVGGTLTIVCYGYWLIENQRSGEEGLRVSRLDLKVSYLLTGLFSCAMMVIGSRLPEVSKSGDVFIEQIASLFASQIGPFAAQFFKVGFFCGVFSSLLGVWQSVPYLFADIRLIDDHGQQDLKTSKPYRQFLAFISLASLTTIGLKFQSIQLLYAVTGALAIPLCALSLIFLFKKKEIVEPFRNKVFHKITLWSSFLFFIAYGINVVIKKFS